MTTIVNRYGQALYAIYGNNDVIELNTPENCIAVEDAPNPDMYYKDGWVNMPTKPSSFCTFNYHTKKWEDLRTLDQARADKWESIKTERDALEYGGFSHNGNIYDSDLKAQSRIIAASELGIETDWVLKNNQFITLSGYDLIDLKQSLINHIAMCHSKGRQARKLLYESTTIEQINSITL